MRTLLGAVLVPVLVGVAACDAILGDPDDCPMGLMPNEVLQACVTPPPCDGGVINDHNECVIEEIEPATDPGGRGGLQSNGGSGGAPRAGAGGRFGGAGDAGRSGAGAGGREAPSARPAGAGGIGSLGGAGSSGTAPGQLGGAGGVGGASGAGGAGSGSAAVCGNGRVDPGEVCDGMCPSECRAMSACVVATLEGSATKCDAECKMTPITACTSGDGCCPDGCTHASDTDCSVRCGDGVISAQEKCEPKSVDKPCPMACDDRDICTTDMLVGSAVQCSAECVHAPRARKPVSCDDGDPCTDDKQVESSTSCAYECEHSTPTPRKAVSCDDGDPCTLDMQVESASSCTYECQHSSPMQREAVSCDDGDPCTDDMQVESASSCTYECRHSAPKSRSGGSCDDGNPCTDDTRTESTSTCSYDCHHSAPKSRSGGSCDDGNSCTDDKRTESTSACSYDCQHPPKPTGADCGGGKMCMNSMCQDPPQRCGDGATQGTEECDAGGETWECDRSCHRTRLYTSCGSGSDCRNGQACSNGACTELCTQQPNGSFVCPSASIPERALGVICYLEAPDYGYCRPRCSSDADCPNNLHCADNVCLP